MGSDSLLMSPLLTRVVMLTANMSHMSDFSKLNLLEELTFSSVEMLNILVLSPCFLMQSPHGAPA